MSNVEWQISELFTRVGLFVINSTLHVREMVRVYNGLANVEIQLKEAKNTLRRDKASSHKF